MRRRSHPAVHFSAGRSEREPQEWASGKLPWRWTTGVHRRLPIIVQMIVPCLHLPYTAEETEDAERNPYLPSMHWEVLVYLPVRYMHQSGLIVMTIMPGWKSGAMEAGIFWEPVSRRRSWIRDGLPTLPQGLWWSIQEFLIPGSRRGKWSAKMVWWLCSTSWNDMRWQKRSLCP